MSDDLTTAVSMENDMRTCARLSYGDCTCGWRAEFGETWADHTSLNGFRKAADENSGIACGRCGRSLAKHGNRRQNSPPSCGWTQAMVLNHYERYGNYGTNTFT